MKKRIINVLIYSNFREYEEGISKEKSRITNSLGKTLNFSMPMISWGQTNFQMDTI